VAVLVRQGRVAGNSRTVLPGCRCRARGRRWRCARSAPMRRPPSPVKHLTRRLPALPYFNIDRPPQIRRRQPEGDGRLTSQARVLRRGRGDRCMLAMCFPTTSRWLERGLRRHLGVDYLGCTWPLTTRIRRTSSGRCSGDRAPRRCRARTENDVRINDFRIGLTDIVKVRAESSDSGLEVRIRCRWFCREDESIDRS